MNHFQEFVGLLGFTAMLWLGGVILQVQSLSRSAQPDDYEFHVNRFLASLLTFGQSRERIFLRGAVVQAVSVLILLASIIGKDILGYQAAYKVVLLYGLWSGFTIGAVVTILVNWYKRTHSN